jgi:signal transduction histidine kinase
MAGVLNFNYVPGSHATFSRMSKRSTWTREGASALFRIFQEILSNVEWHSQASNVKITLEEKDTEHSDVESADR